MLGLMDMTVLSPVLVEVYTISDVLNKAVNNRLMIYQG